MSENNAAAGADTLTPTAPAPIAPSPPSGRELAGAIRVLEHAIVREHREHDYPTQAAERQGLEDRCEDLSNAILGALELLR
jgi:hypothetical protein